MTYTRPKNNKSFSMCGCGCLHSPENLVNVRKQEDGKSIQRKRCPDHKHLDKAEVIYRITTCQKCFREVKFSARGGTVPQWCPECRNEVRKEKMRIYAKERYNYEPIKSKAGYVNNHLRDNSRWNCKYHIKCITKFDKHECIPCKGCKDYQVGCVSVDPLAANYRASELDIYAAI